MRDYLVVQLDGTGPIDAENWVLYLNGQKMDGLTAERRNGQRQLWFQLRRTDANKAAWRALLGSPDAFTRPISVSLAHIDGINTADGSPRLGARVYAADNAAPSFELNILWTWWLLAAVVLVAAGVPLLIRRARDSCLLRDSLLPQIPVLERAYSLGRCQMAFWFLLIISCFVFLWALLWDYDTVTAQALALMGISGATGLAAIAANGSNDDGLKNTKAALEAEGFKQAADIETRREALEMARKDLSFMLNEIAAPHIPEDRKTQLQQQVVARQDDVAKLERAVETYTKLAKPYTHQDFWTDITSDDAGPALHRLQVVAWTIVLGGVFLVEVYRSLAMPEFSGTLLALMAVSGGTYVGFKIPEKT